MSGKRQAASPPADEPDAKQAKGDDADAKATADAETAGATEAGGDDPMETEENGTEGRGARRSMRTRNPVRKASTRNEGKAAKGPLDHLHCSMMGHSIVFYRHVSFVFAIFEWGKWLPNPRCWSS